MKNLFKVLLPFLLISSCNTYKNLNKMTFSFTCDYRLKDKEEGLEIINDFDEYNSIINSVNQTGAIYFNKINIKEESFAANTMFFLYTTRSGFGYPLYFENYELKNDNLIEFRFNFKNFGEGEYGDKAQHEYYVFFFISNDYLSNCKEYALNLNNEDSQFLYKTYKF